MAVFPASPAPAYYTGITFPDRNGIFYSTSSGPGPPPPPPHVYPAIPTLNSGVCHDQGLGGDPGRDVWY